MTGYPYSYDELLFRLHNAKSSDEIYKKINLPPLKVCKKNKLSIFVNFDVYSEKLNRSKEHISNYFKAETNIGNSINNQNQLLIQGILNETKCESIMRNYIKQFVMCRQCKGINSVLVKENGLTFLQCNQCLAKTSMGKV
jgi:translation initiation factor 2 subunit 2